MNWENLPSTNTPVNATNLTKITDSGSNANGNYIKFQDGTLVVWGNKTLSDEAVTTSAGSVYRSNIIAGVTFPINFINTPTYVNLTINTASNAVWIIKGSSAPSTSATGSFYVASYNNITLSNLNVGFFAIGRWK